MDERIFRMEPETAMTPNVLLDLLSKHNKIVRGVYKKLKDAYETDYKIFKLPKKEVYKPDNRIAVNFAKYAVDTFNGFFIGIPIKLSCDDKGVSKYLEFLDSYNDQDDNNAELAKFCDIFGRGYEFYFVDEEGNICITYESPMNSFMVYDNTIIENPLYFIRFYHDENNILHGTVYGRETQFDFVQRDSLTFFEEKRHGFKDVPATEFIENAERIGLFEPVMSMIDAYNKAISEKANDVDYFADAYLKILGAKLEKDDLNAIRQNRIINFEGNFDDKLIVEFLQKPNADTTQENLINRLEKLIFMISMVANISDENFGTSSGIALKYKLQGMSNLAKTKERKFISGMNRRYKVIFSNPISKMSKDAWVGINYHFTQNYPANLLEEAQIAAQLSGIVSKETQLATLSNVDDIQAEMDRINKESDPIGYQTDYPTNRLGEEDGLLG